jgi:hypothetical protein
MSGDEIKKRLWWFSAGLLLFLAFPSLARGEWPRPVFYLFCLLFVALAGYGLASGRVFIKNPREHENKGWCARDEEPFYYWLGIGIYLFAAAAIFMCVS